MHIRTFQDKSPQIGKRVYIDPTAVIIGDVHIGDDASIWPTTVIRGDIHRIHIGDRTNIQDGTIIHVTHAGKYNTAGYPISIGNDVIVGHQVVLHGCTLEDACLIGIGSRILDGARVQKNALVGAGTVVTPGQVIEGGFLWLGSPAKKIRALTEKELAYFQYSANYYVALKDRYLA